MLVMNSASITKLNEEVASLNAQLKTCKVEFDKLKFARDAYTVGRHPSIKDGLGFRKEAKNLTSQRTPIPNKEKGKAPMASSNQKNHAFIYNRKIARHSNYNRSYDHDAFDHMLLLCMVEVGPGREMLFIMCLGKCIMKMLLLFIPATLILFSHAKIKK